MRRSPRLNLEGLYGDGPVGLREFLPSLIGSELTDLIVRGDRRYYRPDGQPFIPLELPTPPTATATLKSGMRVS